MRRGMFDFIKCQSLGNDFILFDWLEQTNTKISTVLQSYKWPEFAQKICKRHLAIGADGILIVRKNLANQLAGLIFNADGSNGYKCLNGMRCIAHYLVGKQNYPENLEVFMGDQLIKCQVTSKVILNVGKISYQQAHQLAIADQTISGHIVSAGNPHFIILQETSLDWLTKHGAYIEQHSDFPNRTNVEFVWPIDQTSYQVLVYERGCGITLACGTGAAAVLQTLYRLDKVKQNESITLHMQGGVIESYIDRDDNIIQQASALEVYSGVLSDEYKWPE